MPSDCGRSKSSAPKMPWFRFYAEALDDPKVQRLEPATFKFWVNLLCLCSGTEGQLPPTDDIAFRLRCSNDDVTFHVTFLVTSGLVDKTANGLAIHSWSNRQYQSDLSTQRVRKHRENKAAKPCNVSETVTETAPDTDTDTDTEEDKPPNPPAGGPTPSQVLEAFEAYNAMALRCGLQQASRLTPGRKRSIGARLREFGVDGWTQALANIEKSSFLTGTNDRGFRANLDFMLQASSYAKLHDGAYGNGRHASTGKFGPPVKPQKSKREADLEYLQSCLDVGAITEDQYRECVEGMQ